jgi:hypothetical protein
MMSVKTDPYEKLVFDILNHSLEINEYSQENKTIHTDTYKELLNNYLELAKHVKDYQQSMTGFFNEYDKIGRSK